MTRNLKALGLALAAVFAMSMTASSAALAEEAQGELKSDGPMTLDASELAGKSNALTAFGLRLECPGSTWTGHKYSATPHELIPNGSTTITVIPKYVNCIGNDGSNHKMTATMNECDYVLHIGETTAKESQYAVSTDIVCPEGKDIQLEVYPFAANELGGVVCTFTVKPQTGLTGPTVTTNVGFEDLALEGTFKGIKIEKSGSGCSSESSSSGEWHLNATVKGTDKAGGATAVRVTDLPEEAQGKLMSDGSVTLQLTELAGKANGWTAFGGPLLECAGTILTAHKTLTLAETEAGKKHEVISVNATSATITPHYPSCHIVDGSGTHKVTVTMNGCDHDLHIGSAISANQYSTEMDIVCPAGKVIETHVYAFAGSEMGGPICTTTIKGQNGLKGATLTSDAVNDDLRIEGTYAGIHVERDNTGGGCPGEATTAAGEWHIAATVEGFNAAGGATGITITH